MVNYNDLLNGEICSVHFNNQAVGEKQKQKQKHLPWVFESKVVSTRILKFPM